MGGLKRKISTDKKIEKKETKSVAFSKRRNGLYSKTAQLCLLSGAQVAILATPVCPKSSVSFYSFGHSSVDSVVSAFLANQRPQEDLGSDKFWWEDESLALSNNSKELGEAVDSISRMLQNLKGLREDMKKKKKKEVVVHGTHEDLDQNQTLIFQSSSSSSSVSPCIQDVPPENFQRFARSSEQKDQIVATSDRNNNGLPGNLDAFNQDLDLDQFVDFETNFEGFVTSSEMDDDVLTNRYPRSVSEGAEHGAMLVHSKSNKDDLHFSEMNEDQIVAISDNNNNNNNNALPGDLYGSKQEVDIDQIFDLVTNPEGPSMNPEMNTNQNENWCSNSKAVEDEAVVFQRDLDQDNLQFSEFFSMS